MEKVDEGVLRTLRRDEGRKKTSYGILDRIVERTSGVETEYAL